MYDGVLRFNKNGLVCVNWNVSEEFCFTPGNGTDEIAEVISVCCLSTSLHSLDRIYREGRLTPFIQVKPYAIM